MISLWTPPSYGTPNRHIRANPNASVPTANFVPFGPDEPNYVVGPNGYLDGAAEDALASLQAAGPRGAAALGVAAGLLFSGWKAALAGGVLGYFAGKFVSNFAVKTVAVVAAQTAKVTS
jgi:hypothetical protein